MNYDEKEYLKSSLESARRDFHNLQITSSWEIKKLQLENESLKELVQHWKSMAETAVALASTTNKG